MSFNNSPPGKGPNSTAAGSAASRSAKKLEPAAQYHPFLVGLFPGSNVKSKAGGGTPPEIRDWKVRRKGDCKSLTWIPQEEAFEVSSPPLLANRYLYLVDGKENPIF